jgi:oleandomycin transport system permease protein
MTTLTAPAPTLSQIEAAASAGNRVTVREWARHSGAMVRRNLLGIKADPEELLGVTVFPIIMTVLFTYVFGGAMKASLQGTSYLQFLVPGIFAQMLTFGTMNVGVKLSTDFSKGVIDRFRSLPIARSAVLNGHLVASMLNLLLASAITMAAASVLGFRVQTSALGFLGGLGVLMALGFGISWVAVYIGSVATTPTAVNGIMQLALFPLMFASSIFAPVNSMPGWLQAFVKVNPLTTAADSARALMSGDAAAQLTGSGLDHAVLITLAWAAGLTLVFAPLSIRAFKRRT